MEKKNFDWGNLDFSYRVTDKRYVANYRDGAWDEGKLTDDATITISECAGVLQYCQSCFEGLKAYTTEDGHIVAFRPD
jgi:branched-chain amino acid aminotransferase